MRGTMSVGAVCMMACLPPGITHAEPLTAEANGAQVSKQAATETSSTARHSHGHRAHEHRADHAHGARKPRRTRAQARPASPRIPAAHHHADDQHRAPSHAGDAAHAPGGGHDHGIETENLFGFTLGSDTEHAGVKGVAVETVGRFGKRDGTYSALSKKLEFAYGLTDDLSMAIGTFAAYHNISGVAGFDDVNAFNFNGIGGEVRWRLLRRVPGGFGVTLHIEPNVQLVDELTGLRGFKFGAENKLIVDTELVKDRVFAAFNLLYEFERVRETGNPEWENGSKIGIAAAISTQVVKGGFVGAELRYLRAYEGLVPTTFAGEALYVGPTVFWQLASNAWLSAAWNVQVAGHEAGNPASLDLVNFERHQGRLKVGMTF